MRFSLDEIADYGVNEDYKEPNWPDDYWPKTHGPGEGQSWEKTVDECKKSMARFEELINDPKRDLLAPFPWAPEHTLLREILLAIQHNAYHLGELVELSSNTPPTT